MKIISPAFTHEQNIPVKYTCDGEDVSPPLVFSDIPKETAALVLIVDDPDVPEYIRSDNMWDHWLVFNIPPTVTELAEGQSPEGVCGMGTAGNRDYKGPCPPDGRHRYRFKLYALSRKLDLSPGVTKAELEQAMADKILDQAELVGYYSR